MGREEVKRALQAMDDEAVREKLAAGDFTAVEGLNLTVEEATLVREAASDYPEVAGFAFDELTIKGTDGPASIFKFDMLGAKYGKAIKFTLSEEY